MSYLIEAFKALNALDEDVFSVSDDGIEKLSAFEDDDTVSDDITIYDVDAENESELEDSYIGKIILDCNVCHSKLYKDKADVVIDEESNDANIDMECPYCYSVDGFKIIGEVAPMTTETEETEENAELGESLKESVEPSAIPAPWNKYLEISNYEPEEGEYTVGDTVEGNTVIAYLDPKDEYADMIDSTLILFESSKGKTFVGTTVSGKIYPADISDFSLDESVKESVDLATKENTVAGVLAKHMPELYAITDVNELRKAVIDIVDNSDIADKAIVSKLRRDLFSKKSIGALLSTIATYMTGTKVAKVGRKNESVEDTLEEVAEGKYVIRSGVSDANPYTLEYSKKTGKHFGYLGNGGRSWVSADSNGIMTFDSSDEADAFAKEHVKDKYEAEIIKVTGPLEESVEDTLGTDLDKYQKWVDYDMKKYHKISNKTNSEIRKAGLQIVKDKYGDYQVTAGQYDESLKESVKDVTITTDDSRTTMTSEEDGKVTVTTEPVENHDEEAEVLAPVSDETEMEIEENSADDMDAEIDDIDSDSFGESLSSVLKEQYDNVKSYKMSSCSFDNNDVVTVNGIIEFASGKKGNAQIKLESHTIDKKGNTTFLTESGKLFSTRYLVSGNLKEKKFITESITSKEDK